MNASIGSIVLFLYFRSNVEFHLEASNINEKTSPHLPACWGWVAPGDAQSLDTEFQYGWPGAKTKTD